MDLSAIILEGTGNPFWMLILAMLLGALHGLEPGHSKTMMAAFIIAVKGTVGQAVLLGLSAAASHTAVVWGLAYLGLRFGNELIAEQAEPWMMMISGAVVVAVAFYMVWSLCRRPQTENPHHRHDPAPLKAAGVVVPAPVLIGRTPEYTAEYAHEYAHAHGLAHSHQEGFVGPQHHHHGAQTHIHHHGHDSEDAHARAHAKEIAARFSATGTATHLQVIGFGLTGGLIPCVGAVTVLLLCLQIDRMALGMMLVGGFSAGLALVLVCVGVAAAWGMGKARTSLPWLEPLIAKAPYLSALLVAFVGVLMITSGYGHLSGGH